MIKHELTQEDKDNLYKCNTLIMSSDKEAEKLGISLLLSIFENTLFPFKRFSGVITFEHIDNCLVYHKGEKWLYYSNIISTTLHLGYFYFLNE